MYTWAPGAMPVSAGSSGQYPAAMLATWVPWVPRSTKKKKKTVMPLNPFTPKISVILLTVCHTTLSMLI